MKYFFTNLIGTFIVDDTLKLVDSSLFKNPNYAEKEHTALREKHKAKPLSPDKISLILELLRSPIYFPAFYERNMILTKAAIKASVKDDQLIIQAIANIGELDKITNLLSKRLREWYGLYFPEFAELLDDHEKFVELVMTKTKQELMTENKLTAPMGADLADIHVQEMVALASRIKELYVLREKHEAYLHNVMKKYCPNVLALAGATIGAKLIELGRGLERLAMMPGSTIQLLGAEKALFRHIKTGSRAPKHGVIINHPLIQNAQKTDKGKAARALADKISLCIRLDYFKGEFKADDYKKELEARFA